MQRHYDITEWLDHLRGFSAGDRKSALESHRRQCDACNATAAWLSQTLADAAGERSTAVPEHVLHNARAIFALRALDKIHVRSGLLARLVFDSFAQPALQGVRSEQRLDVRHLLYDAGAYAIDVRLEHERGTPDVSMIGQIHPAAETDLHVAHIPVELTSNNSVIAQTVSNQFGEFSLKYTPQSGLGLQLGVWDQEVTKPAQPQS